MKKFILLFLLCLMPFSEANANEETSIAYVICKITIALSGTTSKAVSVFVIIITGYSFFVGKVSIGMVIIVVGGMIFVFSAETIVNLITPGDEPLNCIEIVSKK